MTQITDLLLQVLEDKSFDLVTGIPYTALPMAAIVSVKRNKPLIYMRKEAKSYGTKKLIEGNFTAGQTCVVIDDLISTGESKFETAAGLEAGGLKISDIVTVVDRSPNGAELLRQKGYTLTAILHIDEILSVLTAHQWIRDNQRLAVQTFIQATRNVPVKTLAERRQLMTNPLSRKLVDLMIQKESNLILSLDVETSDEFFHILEQTADQIVMVKTHVDILQDFSEDFVKKLTDLCGESQVLIFEDRKFADIGSTVRKQFRSGIYKIADWADFVTVHAIAGEAILDGLFGDLESPRSGFLLAKMSAAGNLISENYTRQVLEIGKNRREVVSGFIGFGENETEIRKLKTKMADDLLLLMPGVNLQAKGDGLGQRYVTAAAAVKGGADGIIVGRGIIQAENPATAAKQYREVAWQNMT